VELEALLEEQNQALRKAQAAASPFDDRRRSISSSDQSYFLPPIQSSIQDGRSPAFAKRDPMPSRGSERQVIAQRRDATALDNLAEAAASSPPAAGKCSPTTPVRNADIDPSLALATVSFPTFPHDIFNSIPQTSTTTSRIPNSDLSHNSARDDTSGALVPFGPEAEGLPPREILGILYARLSTCLIY
jgi:hypothetical protein